ncbi:hypothetical protein ABFS82_08G164700 [Erythranthe guttata]
MWFGARLISSSFRLRQSSPSASCPNQATHTCLLKGSFSQHSSDRHVIHIWSKPNYIGKIGCPCFHLQLFSVLSDILGNANRNHSSLLGQDDILWIYVHLFFATGYL